MSRRICFFTGTRAEYGLLEPLMRMVKADPELELQLVVSGSHLEDAHGQTWKLIEQDGYGIDAKLYLELSSESAQDTCRSMGICISGMGKIIGDLKPDLLVLLGDRFEALAAATASVACNVPVAHLHGGEITQGAIDDSFRHAITKLASLHFTSTEEYRQRVIRMGESPATVFNFGAIGLENVRNMKLLPRVEVASILDVDPDRTFIMVTFHPVTLADDSGLDQLDALLAALSDRGQVVFTRPNADHGGPEVNRRIEEFVAESPDRKVFTSLGQLRYLSAMRHASAVVGNSSSGIIETPSLDTPSVDVGDRQEGRARSESVIHCSPVAKDISRAIDQAFSPEWQDLTLKSTNPYERKDTAKNIIREMKNFTGGVRKVFHDPEHPRENR